MKASNSKILGGFAVGIIVIVGVVWVALHTSGQTAAKDTGSVPTAAVARVTREDLFKQVTISAEFRPFQEVALHAKVSGYVKEMNVDFGDRVKAGQLIATLEVPELKNAAEIVASGDAVIEHIVPGTDALYVGDLRGGPSQIRRFDLNGKNEMVIPSKGEGESNGDMPAQRSWSVGHTAPRIPAGYLRHHSRSHFDAALWSPFSACHRESTIRMSDSEPR